MGIIDLGKRVARNAWRLPVVVQPQSGVHDGEAVTVYGRGFEPGEQLGIVQCTSEADTNASGVNACQLAAYGQSTGFGAVTYASASNEGTVVAKFVVRRYVVTPEGGRVDCLSAAERCLIGVGAVANYDRSGGTYVAFADAPPFAEPAVSVTPGGPYAAGQQVTVDATGLVVAPGFIDIQGHSGWSLLYGDNRVISKISQGVTTEILGEGSTPAPLHPRRSLPRNADSLTRRFAEPHGFARWLNALQARGKKKAGKKRAGKKRGAKKAGKKKRSKRR